MIDNMEYTRIITQDDPVSKYIVIIGEGGEFIGGIRSFNLDTNEAEIYVTDDQGRAIVDWPNGKANGALGVLRTEKKILQGAKIAFTQIVK